jgi:chromosomal replication initiator protein
VFSDVQTDPTVRRRGERGPDPAAALGQAVRARVGGPRYDLWFRQTRLTVADGRLTVGVPNLHFQEWLQKTFAGAVADAACEVLGRPVPVRFAIDPELFQAARTKESLVPGPSSLARQEPAPPVGDDVPATLAKDQGRRTRDAAKPLKRWHLLSEFVVGACNRVAHAAALSVVEEPGQAANPLVLYGPVGTGKTHLLEGVYVGLRRAWPEGRVAFLTAEDFTNRCVQAIRLGRTAAFRKQFRSCEALLLDDLHFLVSKKASQEEFLHTFDALLGDGRQVVVTCDCHPRLADDLPPELADRLLGGAVWGLLPPDPETRLALLRAKSAKGQPAVPDEVLRFLGAHLRGNVRELEGALNGVRHFARVTGRPIDAALAREALGDLLRHAVRVVRVADVDEAVCAVLGLPRGTLQSKARAWAVSHPRMLAIFLARKHTAAAFSEISKHFGGKSHSTAVAAEKKVRQWLLADGLLALGERSWRVRELVERVERHWQR